MVRANPFESTAVSVCIKAASSTDAVDEVPAQWVAEPTSPDELCEVVRISAARNLSLVARGSGRHLALGAQPRRAEVILSTRYLDRVLEHEPNDMTVRVQAGCSLTKLARELASADQWLSLDPPATGETTVGGLLATNLSGPLRCSQGTARDVLIGVRTVGPDGAIVSGGGRVVKNVAGYDLPKMHIGALGTLGVILDATFKLRPRPAHEVALRLPCTSPERASGLALELRDTCEPLWLQILGPTEEGQWSVVVGTGGRSEEVEAALVLYEKVADQAGVPSRRETAGTALRKKIADHRTAEHKTVLRLSTLPSRVGKWLARLTANDIELKLQADLPSGVIHASMDAGTSVKGLVGSLRPQIESEGGHLVLERASSMQKTELLEQGGVWGDPGAGFVLMRGLKEAFDPDDVFAPGRFVGGL